MSPNSPFSNLKTKAPLLARYALAGGLTSGVYMIVYNAFIHFDVIALLTSDSVFNVLENIIGIRFLSSNLANIAALLVQYSAHGKFTFGHRDARKGVLFRYLMAVGFGFILSALISQANTNLYTLPDLTVSLIAVVVVAISNFFLFNFWVYDEAKTDAKDETEKP
jgi:putative flippase GtrA